MVNKECMYIGTFNMFKPNNLPDFDPDQRNYSKK